MTMENPREKYCSLSFGVFLCDDFSGDSSGSDINAQHRLSNGNA